MTPAEFHQRLVASTWLARNAEISGSRGRMRSASTNHGERVLIVPHLIDGNRAPIPPEFRDPALDDAFSAMMAHMRRTLEIAVETIEMSFPMCTAGATTGQHPHRAPSPAPPSVAPADSLAQRLRAAAHAHGRPKHAMLGLHLSARTGSVACAGMGYLHEGDTEPAAAAAQEWWRQHRGITDFIWALRGSCWIPAPSAHDIAAGAAHLARCAGPANGSGA